MTAHAKGPWGVGGVSTPHGMEPYCNIWGPVPPGKQSGQMIAAEVAPENAALIAAAPDLLAALEELTEFRVGFAMAPDFKGSPLEHAVKTALAVIARARGAK